MTDGRRVEQDVYRGLTKKDIYRLARPSAREMADDRDARKLARRLGKPPVAVPKLGRAWVDYKKGKDLENSIDRP